MMAATVRLAARFVAGEQPRQSAFVVAASAMSARRRYATKAGTSAWRYTAFRTEVEDEDRAPLIDGLHQTEAAESGRLRLRAAPRSRARNDKPHATAYAWRSAIPRRTDPL